MVKVEITLYDQECYKQLLLKSYLYDPRLQEGKAIKPHLDELYSIVLDIQNIEVSLENEDFFIFLLCSLPPSKKPYRETLFYGRDTLFKYLVWTTV